VADDEHDHDHEHEHGVLHYEGAEVDEPTLTLIAGAHKALADNLVLSRRYATLKDADKELLTASQRDVEAFAAWTPGFHAPGDMCAVCESPVDPLFTDKFAEGRIPYAAFVDDVPVHMRKECLAGFAAKLPRRSPQALDQLRRATTTDRTRPSAKLTQFFRHDVLLHPPFTLEDWANSVAEANQGKLDRSTARDIERLLSWVHAKLFH
jgi:hypothetical protein